MSERVKDKVAVIVGAGGHLGGPVALRLAQEGAIVHLVDAEREPLHAAAAPLAGYPAEAHIADLQDAAALKAADLEMNLSLTYRAIHAVAAHMKRQRSGHIITLSSTAKDGVPWFSARGHGAHAAARGGVVGLTRALSYELGVHGITVNCVVVGPLGNTKSREVFDSLRSVAVRPEDMIALRRLGSPLDVAHAVLFLASDEADYITGVSLYVSGGLYG